MTKRLTWACAIVALTAACGGEAFTASDAREGNEGAPVLEEDGGADGAIDEETADGSTVLEDGGDFADSANDDAADVEDAAADSRDEWGDWGPDTYVGLDGPCRPARAPEELHKKTASDGMCWPDRCECAPGLRCQPVDRPVEYMTKCLPAEGACTWSRQEGARCWADCQYAPGTFCMGFSSVTYEGTCQRP